MNLAERIIIRLQEIQKQLPFNSKQEQIFDLVSKLKATELSILISSMADISEEVYIEKINRIRDLRKKFILLTNQGA